MSVQRAQTSPSPIIDDGRGTPGVLCTQTEWLVAKPLRGRGPDRLDPDAN